MPVTRTRNGFYDLNLDQTNTTRFLFGDDEPNHLPRGHTPDDSFPTLVRRDDQIVSVLLLFCSCNVSRLEKERRSSLACSLCLFFFTPTSFLRLAAGRWRLAAGSALSFVTCPLARICVCNSPLPPVLFFLSCSPPLLSFPSVQFLFFSSSLASHFSASCTTFIQPDFDL